MIKTPNEDIGCIYAIINTETNSMYVGCTTRFRQRISQHLSQLRSNAHPNVPLNHAWQKFGESCFDLVILEESDNPEPLEIKWITELAIEGNKLYNVYNTAKLSNCSVFDT